MLILHTLYMDNAFYLWGESSFDTLPEIHREKTGTIPWCTGYNEMQNILNCIDVKNKRKPSEYDFRRIFFMLPEQGGYPIPSSGLVGELTKSDEPVTLRRYRTDAIELGYEQFCSIAQMIMRSGEKLPISGISFAQDTLYLVKVLEYALVLAHRGSYIPDIKYEANEFYAFWNPIFLTKFEEEHRILINSVPPVLCSVSNDPDTVYMKDRKYTVDNIITGILDSSIRDSCQSGTRGRRVDVQNPQELWMRALTWPKGTLDMWKDEMRQLYPHIRSWSESLKDMTDQPWRLYIKIVEPEPEQTSWTLLWNLQSTEDYATVIPASEVWNPSDKTRMRFNKTGENPRRYLLNILGTLAEFLPSIEACLVQNTPVAATLSSVELADFMQKYYPSALELGIYVESPESWENISERSKVAVKAIVEDNFSLESTHVSLDDMLTTEWYITLNGKMLSHNEILYLTRIHNPLTKIWGKWMLISHEEVEKAAFAISKLPKTTQRRELLMSSFSGYYRNIPVHSINGSTWLDMTREVLLGHRDITTESQPETIKGTLRPYQLKGFSWLLWLTRLGLGGCLADDMGLGKTIQTLALIERLRNDGENRPVLLVCPTSVIENWNMETKKFLPNLPVFIHHGIKRLKGKKFVKAATQSALVITSYALLHRDKKIMKECKWCGVVLDEAQNIKNPDTKQSKSAREIQADWHIALTGTPVENHVGDMWSIMEFLVPGLLPSKNKFNSEYLRPIQAGNALMAEKIRKIISPFVLRRLKSDKNIISDLPDKIETKVFCPLEREQANLYKRVLAEHREAISSSEGIKRRGRILATITALKQVCNHPALYLKDNSSLEGRSGKMERLSQIAEELISTDGRVLIFTQYSEMGRLIKQYIEETFGQEALFLHGGVPKKKRDEMVNKFQQDKDAPRFFILSLKAGGSGINLTRANHVIMFDRWWNPAVEQQAVDRAYRIGQDRNVQVHYFCCKGTLEEKIEDLINTKKAIADTVIKSEDSLFANLTDTELNELFALSCEEVDD